MADFENSPNVDARHSAFTDVKGNVYNIHVHIHSGNFISRHLRIATNPFRRHSPGATDDRSAGGFFFLNG